MEVNETLKLIEIIATLFVGIVGLYFANNYRRQIRQKTTEGRIIAYGKLWEITKIATPMREKNWHEGKYQNLLTHDERKELYKAMTDWYYEKGNGIFLGDTTRRMYLSAKHNLLCPEDEVLPVEVSESLKILSKDKILKKRSELSIRQLSLLRHRMRADLEVYGSAFFGELTIDDKQFLNHCGENWRKKHWKGKK